MNDETLIELGAASEETKGGVGACQELGKIGLVYVFDEEIGCN